MSQQRNIKDFDAVSNTAVTGTSRFPVIIDGVLYTITRDELAILFQNNSIADGSVTTAKLANLAVTTAKLANNAVDATKLADDAVTTDKLLNLAVTESKIANGAVTARKLADENVTTEKLANEAVTNVKLANNAVTTGKIQNGAVDESKLADNAVTTDKLLNFAVTTRKLADENVTTVKLANEAVTAPKLAPNAVETSKIQNGAVTLQKTSAFIYGNVSSSDAGETISVFRGGTSVSITFTFNHTYSGIGQCIRIQLNSLTISGFVVATLKYESATPLSFTTIRAITTSTEIFLFLINSSGGVVNPSSTTFYEIDFIAI